MSFSFVFRPRLLDALRGYNHSRALADLGAGATVGVVALPLAMAFAIASGLPPQAGLWTAIIGGFLVALLGGTNVQIGGPAGAFIVIVYGIVERYGVANLLISTACAGVLLFALGLLRLGNLVRFVPVSIVIGFTNGIAVLIAVSQLKDFLGLSIEKMPGNFFSQVHVLALHIDSANPYALGLGAACLGGLFLWPRLFMHDSPVLRIPGGHTVRSFVRIPAPVIALITLTALSNGMGYPVETLGTRFGGIPQSLPVFALPEFSWDTVRLLVAPTITIALLGAIESLLCARVADQLASSPHIRKHDPNQELMAQGVANFVVPFFGGMPVTGTIAARSPTCAPEPLHPSPAWCTRPHWPPSCWWQPRWHCIFRWPCSRAYCCTWPGTWGNGMSLHASSTFPTTTGCCCWAPSSSPWCLTLPSRYRSGWCWPAHCLCGA